MRLSNRNLLAAAIGVLGIIWCLFIFVIPERFGLSFRCTGAVIFVLSAVALSILYLTVFRHSPGRQATEVGALSIYFTIGYVASSMILNTKLVLSGRGGFNISLLLCNAIVNIIYIFLIVYAEKDAQRLSEQLDRTRQKISGPVCISAKLGELLGIAEDSQIRARLLKLKEAVDYSTNITTGATFECERQMERQLDELMHLMTHQEEPSAIQDKIHEAELTWKTRGSAAAFKG
ncbi:MAG: hypothetical protein HDT33_07175 [Clostridiales bacterium]|nr:hypothetical protein [Clostridiales bacterium]